MLRRLLYLVFLFSFIGVFFTSKASKVESKEALTHRHAQASSHKNEISIDLERVPAQAVNLWRKTEDKRVFSGNASHLIIHYKREAYISKRFILASLQLPEDYLFFIYPSHNFW